MDYYQEAAAAYRNAKLEIQDMADRLSKIRYPDRTFEADCAMNEAYNAIKELREAATLLDRAADLLYRVNEPIYGEVKDVSEY